MSKRSKERLNLVTEEVDEYTPQRSRIAPARQLCTGSSREVVDRPQHDRCPVCERIVELVELRGKRVISDFDFAGASGGPRPDSRTVYVVYVIPPHLMKKL